MEKENYMRTSFLIEPLQYSKLKKIGKDYNMTTSQLIRFFVKNEINRYDATKKQRAHI